MKHPDDKLVTPIFVKSQADMPWPDEERVFYVLAADGLFLCRNHPLFQSSVRAPYCPSELCKQGTSLRLRYPKVPRKLFESIIGFFDRIGHLHGSEAAVLLAWDRTAQQVRAVVPQQVATVSRSWNGTVYPIGVYYDIPANLPADWAIIGDIHSHVDGAAYASAVDKYDESHRAGLHIVVGRLCREPPELHIEVVVDSTRFPVAAAEVIEGYQKRRRRVPQAWIDKVRVEPPPKKGQSSSYSTTWGDAHGGNFSSGYHSGSYYQDAYPPPIDPVIGLPSKNGSYSPPKRVQDGDGPDTAQGDQP